MESEYEQQAAVLEFYNECAADLIYKIEELLNLQSVAKYHLYQVPILLKGNNKYSQRDCAKKIVSVLRKEGMFAKSVNCGSIVYISWEPGMIKTQALEPSSNEDNVQITKLKDADSLNLKSTLPLNKSTDKIDILNFFLSTQKEE